MLILNLNQEFRELSFVAAYALSRGYLSHPFRNYFHVNPRLCASEGEGEGGKYENTVEDRIVVKYNLRNMCRIYVSLIMAPVRQFICVT